MELKAIDGEVFRYYVDEYLVDLRGNYGVGFCGCQDFEFRRLPELADHHRKPKEPDIFRCKHIRFARREIGLRLLDELLTLNGPLKEL